LRRLRARCLLAAAAAAVLACAPGACADDEPEVTATLSQSRVRVGDRVDLDIHITAADPSRVSVGDLDLGAKAGDEDPDSTWSLVAGRSASHDEPAADGRTHRRVRFTIAPFRTGTIAVPQVEVSVQPTSGTAETTSAINAGEIEVTSVLPADADPKTLEPRDIKGVVAVPAPRWLWPAVVAAAGALALALAWFLWSRLRRRVAAIIRPPQRLDEWALSELSAIEAEHLPEHKKVKEHYTRVTDVVRRYLGGVFGFDAIDLTTHEAMQALEDIPQSAGVRASVQGLLEEADLVKFAKHQPEMPACRRALEGARGIVAAARPMLAPPQDAQGPAAGGGAR
jgi:hypothetical protein